MVRAYAVPVRPPCDSIDTLSFWRVGAIDRLPHDISIDHVFVQRRVAAAGAAVPAELRSKERARAVPAIVDSGAKNVLNKRFSRILVLAIDTAHNPDLVVDNLDCLRKPFYLRKNGDRAEDLRMVEHVAACDIFD